MVATAVVLKGILLAYLSMGVVAGLILIIMLGIGK